MTRWFALSERRIGNPYAAFVAFFMLVRSITPAGFMPAFADARDGWPQIVICYGQTDAPGIPDNGTSGYAHDVCLFHGAVAGFASALHAAVLVMPPVLVLAEKLLSTGLAANPLSLSYNQMARGPPPNEHQFQT